LLTKNSTEKKGRRITRHKHGEFRNQRTVEGEGTERSGEDFRPNIQKSS